MIDRLRKKISLIIFIAIFIPLIIAITFFTISYRNNVIKTNTRLIDRFFSEPNGNPNSRAQDFNDIDGIYSFSIRNEEISSNNYNNTQIQKQALKALHKKDENGIIGNYIFVKRLDRINKDEETRIILIESKDEIKKINLVMLSGILITSLLFVFISLLSRKIANLIVKPVKETFNKQRDFISDASHELKTPLSVIKANSYVLEEEIGHNKWMSYIKNETENMEKLINELLLLTKIENIDTLRTPEEFNMSRHILLIISSFESMAFEKGILYENDIQEDVITHTFNKDDIAHILSTLIDNAIKHTNKRRKVIINFRKIKDKIIIEVKNQGKEIKVEEREKIFDRFYRIDKSRNRSEKRYGLGLSIAKATVLKNNGSIQVSYKDGFTIFKVELPI